MRQKSINKTHQLFQIITNGSVSKWERIKTWNKVTNKRNSHPISLNPYKLSPNAVGQTNGELKWDKRTMQINARNLLSISLNSNQHKSKHNRKLLYMRDKS